jgi:nitrogen fixation-related uncharacterized protein
MKDHMNWIIPVVIFIIGIIGVLYLSVIKVGYFEDRIKDNSSSILKIHDSVIINSLEIEHIKEEVKDVKEDRK